jgi:hypothetical protein
MHSTEGPVHRLVPTKQTQNLCSGTPLNFLPATMASLWTWLVLVLKEKRGNLPFRNVSDNRTKIDLNLLVC